MMAPTNGLGSQPTRTMEGRIEMYPSQDARELAILLRISRELDIVGDVTATVDNPSELLAWATTLTSPDIISRVDDPSQANRDGGDGWVGHVHRADTAIDEQQVSRH